MPCILSSKSQRSGFFYYMAEDGPRVKLGLISYKIVGGKTIKELFFINADKYGELIDQRDEIKRKPQWERSRLELDLISNTGQMIKMYADVSIFENLILLYYFIFILFC
jgi:hypothetical protein